MALQIRPVLVPIHTQVTCSPTTSGRHCLAEPSMWFHDQCDCRRRLTLTCQNHRFISISHETSVSQFGHQAIKASNRKSMRSHPTNQSQGRQLSVSVSAWQTVPRRTRSKGSQHILVARRPWWIFLGFDLTIWWRLQIARHINLQSCEPRAQFFLNRMERFITRCRHFP